jgi:hypothetical protein
MPIRAKVHGQHEESSIVRVQLGFRWAIALYALIDCWIYRFYINSDGVSYLDIGDQYWKGNWQAALNAYWSPLYSWLTGLMFCVTKPTMRWEYPEVHLLNFVILVAALFCFEFFWRELLAWRGDNAWAGSSRLYAWILGYLLFAYVHFVVTPILIPTPDLMLVTPDLIVAALVYLASGMILRFATGRMCTVSAGLFGGLLGVGYLAKTAMLPFAIVIMMTMLAVAWRQHGRKWMIGATLLGFLIVSLPFIIALSLHEHRFTFGDTGKINYAIEVNGMPARHWQGDEPGHTKALHPTRKIFSWPQVYEFAEPVAGTYPIWYDRSYWNAGINSSMHPVRQIRVLVGNAMRIAQYLVAETGFLTAVLMMMFLLSDRIKESWQILMGFFPILVPAIAMFLMYAMVLSPSESWEPRYFIGVTVVAWGAVIASTCISGEEKRIKVLRASSLILGIMVLCSMLNVLERDYGFNREESSQVNEYRPYIVAEQLRTMGMRPGDHVAVISSTTGNSHWARLEKVKIIAEVMDTDDTSSVFWTSGKECEETVLSVLKSIGVTAVIADKPPRVLLPGWVPVGNTGYAVYFFR